MGNRVDELKAELEVAQLEEKLVEAKDTKDGPTRQLKEKVREARRRFRELREGDAEGAEEEE